MTTTSENTLNNFKTVDVLKYIMAIFVICIHCNPIVSNVYLDYLINQILCRIAVPFFFISSAYFVRKGIVSKEDYLKSYLKKLSLSYLGWSLLFIPIGLDWIHQNLSLSQELLPFTLFFGIVHVGTYYHLWYIPALILSLFIVDKLLKKFSYKNIIPFAILLFLFGSLETYYGLLANNLLKQFFDLIIQIFFTTRSGLLYGTIFVVIGFFIYDKQEQLKPMIKHLTKLTFLFALLLVIEGMIVYPIIKLDMNFLITLIPFSFFFFLRVLSYQKKIAGDTKKIRNLSKYYYFVHVICIVIVEEVGKGLGLPILKSGILSFLLIVLLTHLLSLVLIAIQEQPLRKLLIPFAGILGMCLTFFLSSVIYHSRLDNVVMKFELVPCIWICSSLVIYYLLIGFRKKSAVNS